MAPAHRLREQHFSSKHRPKADGAGRDVQLGSAMIGSSLNSLLGIGPARPSAAAVDRPVIRGRAGAGCALWVEGHSVFEGAGTGLTDGHGAASRKSERSSCRLRPGSAKKALVLDGRACAVQLSDRGQFRIFLSHLMLSRFRQKVLNSPKNAIPACSKRPSRSRGDPNTGSLPWRAPSEDCTGMPSEEPIWRSRYDL